MSFATFGIAAVGFPVSRNVSAEIIAGLSLTRGPVVVLCHTRGSIVVEETQPWPPKPT